MGLLLSLAMLALATPAFAENRADGFTISPYMGGYTYDHDQSYQNLEISPIYGLRMGYNFDKNWGVEGRFGYALAESRGAKFQEADVYSYGIDALFHLNVTPNFVPFLAVGMGGIHHNYPASGFGYYPEYTANYGLGIKYFVADNVALRADVRHIILPDDKLQNLEYTAGVTFMIGGERPPVAQVQAQPMPECPPVPIPVEARDTTAPYVTLVTPLDGSADASTRTETRIAFSEPMDPATINTKTITLYQGKMPVQGTVSAPTNRSASFTQAGELAPNTLYTGRVSSGVRDLAGNPMANDYAWSFKTAAVPATRVETLVQKTTETRYISKLVMLKGTHFEFDKANLTPEGKELVQKNIQIMKDNTDLRVRIEGHTSASGSAKYNQDLSERRANAVRTYMVQEGGIAPDRLEAIGYGKTRPAVPEARPSDKESRAAQANRRVVFEIIEKK
jgi:OOP family OmpA-OmpF porin